MKRYGALLRGINISGKNKVVMAELKKEIESLMFENVKTYLNSGNVIFSSRENIEKITKQIEEMLKKNYEFKIVLTKGRFYIGKQLKIVILKNGKNFKTLGIAVSTKNGKAFQRNKAKRLIREAYKNLEEKIINGYSIVVLLKKDIDINDMKYIDIINEMENTFKKANIIS